MTPREHVIRCRVERGYSEGSDEAFASTDATFLLAALDEAEKERDNLARWKAEALPVLDGLQEIGKALGLPLGTRITGPQALEAIEALLADKRALVRDRNHEMRAKEEHRQRANDNYDRLVEVGDERDQAIAQCIRDRERLAKVEALLDGMDCEWGAGRDCHGPTCCQRAALRAALATTGEEGWLGREAERARERAASVPPHARPTIHRPTTSEEVPDA